MISPNDIITLVTNSILSAIIASSISYQFNKKTYKNKSLDNIKSKARTLFLTTLIEIEKNKDIDPFNILIKNFSAQEKIIKELSFVLPKRKFKKLEKKWKAYAYYDGYNYLHLTKYADFGQLNKRENNRLESLKKLKEIIIYLK